MDWSNISIPAMRLEPRFGDRVVPAFCERPATSGTWSRDAAAKNPDAEALVCGDTAHELARGRSRQSARHRGGFPQAWPKPGDRVAILLGNRIEFPLMLFAAAHQGLVTVLLGTRQQKPEIAYVLNDCGANCLIHEASLADRVPDASDVPS